MRETANILIVEDDFVDVEVLQRLIKKNAIDNPVYHASNGIEALEIMRGENAKAKIPSPFIILLDINMPMMNGIELLAELRDDENLRNNIVFMVTSSPRKEDIAKTYDLNVAGYFLKNDLKDLVSLIGMYLNLNEFETTGQLRH